MSHEIAVRGSGALTSEESSSIEALFPGKPEIALRVARSIQYLRSQFSANVVRESQEQLLVRIADYMRRYGMTVGDVTETFRLLVSPTVAARIEHGSHLLQQFAIAVPGIMRARREREEMERRDREEKDAVAWRQTPEGIAAWNELRKRFTAVFTSVPEPQRGNQRGKGSEETKGAKSDAEEVREEAQSEGQRKRRRGKG